MRVRFWGTRGSIATPGPRTLGYGGNTSCVEVQCGEHRLIFDAGTGIRELGLLLMHEAQGAPITVHLFISHTHWDHIQGFPFFLPAYQPSTAIHVYGSPGQGRSLERVLRGQMDADYFPVALGDLSAAIHIHEFRGEAFRVGDAHITAMYLNHPGMNLGYRIRHGGRTVVYATDNEPYRRTLDELGRRAEAGREFGGRLDEEFVRFVAGADLYIGEAQYKSLARPGGNTTGPATLTGGLTAKRLELFKEAVPNLTEIAFLVNPVYPGVREGLTQTEVAGRALGVRIRAFEVRDAAEVDSAFAAILRVRPDGLLVMPDPVTSTHMARIVEFAAKNRLPAMDGRRQFPERGGLIAYGIDYAEHVRGSIRYVDKILKGAKPADLPVEQPTKFDLSINLRTAKAFGLTIPPSVLLRADHVIQ